MKNNTGPLLIIFTSLCWASDSLFRIGVLKLLDPIVLVLLEHSILVLLTGWILLQKRHLFFKMKKVHWSSASIIGLGGSALALILFTTSFQYINPTIAILFQKLHPVFAILTATKFLKEKVDREVLIWGGLALVAGIFLGFSELEVLNNSFGEMNIFGEVQDPKLGIMGLSFAISAALIWGVSTTASRHLAKEFGSTFPMSLRFFMAWVFLLVIGFSIKGGDTILSQTLTLFDGNGWIFLLLLTLISGLLAMVTYYYGLKSTEVQVATFLESLWPAFAVGFNWIAYGIELTSIQMVSGLILVVAVAKLQRRGYRGN